jgi:hypothetical protein
VFWQGPLGTVAVVGIATKDALLQSHGYLALIGSDSESWGWNIVDNRILHNGESQGSYPQLNNPPKYQVRMTPWFCNAEFITLSNSCLYEC